MWMAVTNILQTWVKNYNLISTPCAAHEWYMRMELTNHFIMMMKRWFKQRDM